MGVALPKDTDGLTWAMPTEAVTLTTAVQGFQERRFLAYVDGLPMDDEAETPEEARAVSESQEDIREDRVTLWEGRKGGARRAKPRAGNSS